MKNWLFSLVFAVAACLGNFLGEFAVLGGLGAIACAEAGCASKANLDPGGVYKGDAILFNAERITPGAFIALDTYVKWEKDNRVFLAAYPEVKKSADFIRANAPSWKVSADSLHDAYAAAPTEANRQALEQIIRTLEAALTEAAKYIAQYSTTHPAKT